MMHPESLMMSYGYDPLLSEGAIKSPIFQTSTFVFRNAEEGKAFFELAYGKREKGPTEELGLIYSRLNNPDLEILEDRLTLWDDAEACIVFQSGMAAISTTLLALTRPGDVILHSDPLYGGTEYLLRQILPEFHIETYGFRAGGTRDGMEASVEQAKASGRLAAILIETPANPTNDLVDIAACAAVAEKHGRSDRKTPVIVDNTFLGPVWQRPLEHGADLVIYSATKFIGGHSDVIAGACLGSQKLLAPIRGLRTFLGTMSSPMTGWMLMRSLETLKLRMTAQMKNARYVADFLADHPKVQDVSYLGHIKENDPQYALYRKQCLGPGSIVSFEIAGGEAEAFRLLNNLQLIKLAVSLGGTESLAEHPATMTHSDVSTEDQLAMGITPSLVRLSVGVEHPEDVIADLEEALKSV
jgi:methionine-gamma-lyase